MRYEATNLRNGRYAVRPAGTLGTCGVINGVAWNVVYVTARNAADALLKFHCSHKGREPIAAKDA